MYDLNGNLLGKLAAGDGSLPIAFKNLLSGKWAHAERALRRDGEEIGTARRQIGARAEPRDDRRASDSRHTAIRTLRSGPALSPKAYGDRRTLVAVEARLPSPYPIPARRRRCAV